MPNKSARPETDPETLSVADLLVSEILWMADFSPNLKFHQSISEAKTSFGLNSGKLPKGGEKCA